MVFAENSVCCWVERIFGNGNAATASIGDKLKVGDQLAAINGVTSMGKSVPDICRMLANAADPSVIDLTLVRYTGAIFPASKEQQGYEVIDTKLRGRFSPVNFAKKISFSKSKSPTNLGDTDDDEHPQEQEVIKIKANKIIESKMLRTGSRQPRPCTPPSAAESAVVGKKVTSTGTPKASNAGNNNDAKASTKETKVAGTDTKKKKKKMFGFLRKGKKKKGSK